VLALAGLDSDQIKAYDIEVWDQCTIRTIEVGFGQGKP